ncbi:hypothetical protein SprV_0301073500 [Sparganum proliferum]
MRRNQRIPVVFFIQWTKNFLLAASLQTTIGQCALADLPESQQNYVQGSNNLSYLTEFDLNDDKFSVSHRLLDTVTYAFCTIGILSNFFAYALLNGKSTIGVLLIKLVLLSDGLVCVFYLLNQVWTDITINYLMNSLVTEYLSRKPILQHISNVLRTLAVTTVSVSNWYIVCMILHRCLSIYANPMRGRFEKSLWVLAQKPPNLWLAFLSCWLFSLLQASLTLHRFPLVLDVLTFVLPLCLVFLSSIILLYGLRAIQRGQNSNLPAGGPQPKSFGCCGALCSPHRCGKGDLDETFAQTKVQTGTPDNVSTCTAHNCYAGASPNAKHARGIDCKEKKPYNPPNSDTETRANHELTELRRKRIYSRVTMTILSLAVSFLVLDSLQFADLLIRIPWQNILGSVEDHRRQNLSWIPLPHLNITIDLLMREVQMSGEKQSVLSIVKNSCTLGKTLTNFIILCAHSRHFRFLLIAHFRRLQRLLRSLKYRCCQRTQRRHLYWAVAPTCAPAFAQPNCASCDKKKRVRWHDHRGQQPPPLTQQQLQQQQTIPNRCHCLRDLKFAYNVNPTHGRAPRMHEVATHSRWPFVSPKRSLLGAHFVRTLHVFSRRAVGGSDTSASKTSSAFSRCDICRRRRQTYGDLLGWRTQWKRRSKRRSTKQPLSWQQGMIFYKPPLLLPTGPVKQGLLGSGDGSGDGSQLSSKSCSGLKHVLHQAEGVSFSSGKSSDVAKCLSSTSGNGSSGCHGFSESSNSAACFAVCLYQSASISSNQKTTKQHEVRSVG